MTHQQHPNHEVDVCWFYIVQKCWYSGPNVLSPIDYLRLLPSVGEAEQVAYQSAHAYATGSRSPVVRTIQMPMATPSASSSVASSYGFVANGVLFWIRKVPVYKSRDVPINPIVDSAHCIVSCGIIGGTGNANSRRGSEVSDIPRAYVGPAGYAWALQQSASGGIPPGSTCQWIPVGKPNFENITAEWPDRKSWSIQIQQQAAAAAAAAASNTKRGSESSLDDHYWYATSTSASDTSDLDESRRSCSASNDANSMMMDCTIMAPVAKRRCSRGTATASCFPFGASSPSNTTPVVRSMMTNDTFMGN